MTAPQENDDHFPTAPDSEDDTYGTSGPAERAPLPINVEKLMRDAEKPRVVEAEPPPPPEWPMFSGVFNFPWYMDSVGYWAVISLGFVLTFLLLGFMFYAAAHVGLIAFRALALPTIALSLLTTAYAFACCLKVIEETACGWDSVDIEVGIDWKEWGWCWLYVMVLLTEAALIGALVWVPFSWLSSVNPVTAPLVSAVGTLVSVFVALVIFPIFLLSAMAAGSAWLPLAISKVTGTMGAQWLVWLLFYLETGAITVAWCAVTVASDFVPWLAPFVSGPALAAAMLIYARLLGRLALCIGEDILAEEKASKEKRR